MRNTIFRFFWKIISCKLTFLPKFNPFINPFFVEIPRFFSFVQIFLRHIPKESFFEPYLTFIFVHLIYDKEKFAFKLVEEVAIFPFLLCNFFKLKCWERHIFFRDGIML